MKRKEAIKQIQEGKIQIENDFLPSTEKIKKFLKECFPEDDYLEKYPNEVDEISRRYFQKASYDKDYWVSSNGWKKSLPIISLSTITKRKKTKLNQLEKQFSDLAKDVSELRQGLAKDVEVDVELIQQETIKEEEIDFSVPQLLIYKQDESFILMINGIYTTDKFEAHVILDKKGKSGWEIGSFSDKWVKDCFEPFKGELTIK